MMEGLEDRHSLKRKRGSDDGENESTPPPKTAKQSNHLAINYLARQSYEDLPLASSGDSLQTILHLLTEYHGVLERHESMAFNLGAKPLGPILLKRFERMFEEAPKILKCTAKDGSTVTWLDVVEFARKKPEQFLLDQMSEGNRVCQIFIKQCRVQISEEDYLCIQSGMPHKLIPPQPVVEDEEKELGTLQILERNLQEIYQIADQVAARGRQLRHRINSRKQAILDRRAADVTFDARNTSPSNIALINGSSTSYSTPNSGVRHITDSNGRMVGLSKSGATESTIQDLHRQFSTVKVSKRYSGVQSGLQGQNVLYNLTSSSVRTNPSAIAPRPEGQPGSMSLDLVGCTASPSFSTPVSINSKADDGPFKSEMIARMENVKRGDRIMPPCDRCRRLHMDCIKNLTACQGCTKKHAKCSWKEVRVEELAVPINAHTIDASHDISAQVNRLRQDGIDNQANGHTFDAQIIGPESSNPMPRVASIALDAAAGLQAVARASAAALESSEAEQRPFQEHVQYVQHVQSPNLIHQPHQSPSLPCYGEASPTQSHHPPGNTVYASNGHGQSSEHRLVTTGEEVLRLEEKPDSLGIRTGEGLLDP